jgi:hypothetical protein
MEDQAPAQSLVLFVSDFQDRFFDGAFGERLRAVSKRFDFVPVVVADPLERGGTLPQSVAVAVRDSETDRWTEIELTPQLFARFQEEVVQRREHLEYEFLEVGLEPVWVDTPSLEGCYQALATYFDSRKRTRR